MQEQYNIYNSVIFIVLKRNQQLFSGVAYQVPKTLLKQKWQDRSILLSQELHNFKANIIVNRQCETGDSKSLHRINFSISQNAMQITRESVTKCSYTHTYLNAQTLSLYIMSKIFNVKNTERFVWKQYNLSGCRSIIKLPQLIV